MNDYIYFQNPVLSAQVASLVSGVNGAVTIAVFSSGVPGTFAVPRTVPANAVLIAEPPVGITSRQSSRPTSHRQPKHAVNGSSFGRLHLKDNILLMYLF